LEVAVNIADESDATNTAFAEITVGAQKVTLQDGAEVKIGSDQDSIDGTVVRFVDTASTGNITKLTVQVAAQDSDEDAIVAGSSFVDPVFGTFKVNFAGISIPTNSSDREDIKVYASGNDKMQVKFMNHRGDEKTVVFANNESTIDLADGDNDIYHVVENEAVNKSEYVVVGNQDEGYLLEVTTISNSSSGYDNDKVEFKDVFSSDTYKATISAEGVGSVTIGGLSYSLTYVGASSASEDTRQVRLNYPDSAANILIVFPTIETDKGAKLTFYEPVTINLSSHDGAGTDVVSLLFPDGDDYASAITAVPTAGGVAGNGVTINGQFLNRTTTASVTVPVGQLNYNFTAVSGNASSDQVRITLMNTANTSELAKPAILVFEEENDANAYEALQVTLGGAGTSDSPLSVSDVEATWGDGAVFDDIQSESNDDLYMSMDVFGSIITHDRTDSDQYLATISYPDEQVDALLYAGELSSAVTSSGSGSGTKELGSVHVKDTEVASVSSKNLIVVGGSCVNTLAKELLGGAACGSDFEQKTGVGAGSFLIQSFSRTGGKVATLVAGYSAADTEAGAKVLTTQTVDTTVGKKYKGTGNTVAMVDTTSA